MAAILAIVLLTLVGRAAIAPEQLDFSALVFPRDARELVQSRDRYFDSLEYFDDKIIASIKRLYAVSFLKTVGDQCGEAGFWSNLRSLSTSAGLFLQEVRGDKEIDAAYENSRYERAALKRGAADIGVADAEALIAQGLCDAVQP